MAVQSLQKCLGFPNDVNLANAIDYNIIGTFQFNHRDICIANKIYGPSIASLKGKSTRQWNKIQHLDVVTDIPKEIMDLYGKVHLDIEIMFINKCVYFTAILQHIRLIHCWVISVHESKWVVNVMEHIIDMYCKRGFEITTVHGNNEFGELNDVIIVAIILLLQYLNCIIWLLWYRKRTFSCS